MKKVLTSVTAPIRIDFLSKVWEGELGISFAPGKKQESGFHGSWDRSLTLDLERIKNYYKIDAVVCLLEQKEMIAYKIPNYLEELAKAGLRAYHFPVVDTTVPKNEEQYKKLVQKIVTDELRKGFKVLVHCRGGLGRAGTFAASCLIYEKKDPKQAIKMVRKAREHAVNE